MNTFHSWLTFVRIYYLLAAVIEENGGGVSPLSLSDLEGGKRPVCIREATSVCRVSSPIRKKSESLLSEE